MQTQPRRILAAADSLELKSVNIDDFLILVAARNSAAEALSQGHEDGHNGLPPALRASASSGLRVFPVFQASKLAPDSRIKEYINQATVTLEEFKKLSTAAPARWAITTGRGIVAVDMKGEIGVAAFKGLVVSSIISLEGEAFDWQTLNSQSGTTTIAVYRYPAGMTFWHVGNHLVAQIILHGDRDYVLIGFGLSFPGPDDAPIAPVPQFLLDLAFGDIPPEHPIQPPPLAPPRNSGSRFVRNGMRRGAKNWFGNAPRREYQVRGGCGGWGGKSRISRRN